MNHLPPCIILVKPGDIYEFSNVLEDYETILDKYITEMKKSSIPILFTKTDVLDTIHLKQQHYYETLNESSIMKTQRYFLQKEKELQEIYSQKNSFYITFVIRVIPLCES